MNMRAELHEGSCYYENPDEYIASSETKAARREREQTIIRAKEAFEIIKSGELLRLPRCEADSQQTFLTRKQRLSKQSLQSLSSQSHEPATKNTEISTHQPVCPFASMKTLHTGETDSTWPKHKSTTSRLNSVSVKPHSARLDQRLSHDLMMPRLPLKVIEDPIAAEFHSPPPSSVNNSLTKCPIRFLDQHSPEEVAEYFRNHKHEIPRSHELCVKRYQSNAESIRQLDAKYGNLVSMIQGLGIKHQPILAHSKDGDKQGSVVDKVEQWAEAVNTTSNDAMKEMKEMNDQDQVISPRESHFDRPLKDIRVGESPSRPWGISIPLHEHYPPKTPALSVKGDPNPTTKIQQRSNSTSSSKRSRQSGSFTCNAPSCLHARKGFSSLETYVAHLIEDHKLGTKRHETPTASGVAGENKEERGMIFTGPVFIGHPAEESRRILKDLVNMGVGNDDNKGFERLSSTQ